MPETIDTEYYEVADETGLAGRLLLKAREKMAADFMAMAAPDASTTILDVGVSDVQMRGANHLESVYPHKARMSACGLGAGAEFRKAFPEIAYTQIVPNAPLPFGDRAFDVAVANAVLEHVGSTEKQRAFVRELMRVARTVFLTVPHRYFPVEHHTAIPFLHFFDPTFRLGCRLLKKERWLREDNLILMTQDRLKALAPEGAKVGRTGLPLGPFSSNLYLFIDQETDRPL